jgi:hypothetical protein
MGIRPNCNFSLGMGRHLVRLLGLGQSVTMRLPQAQRPLLVLQEPRSISRVSSWKKAMPQRASSSATTGASWRCVSGIIIPFDPANTDYQEYLKWLAEGNTPEPAEEA